MDFGTVIEIVPGVLVNIVETGANLGALRTSEGPVLIDTPLIPAEAREWQSAISQMTNRPARYIINTDHHRAHCLGNQHFNATVIAHEFAWKEMTSFSDSFRQRVADRFRRRNPQAYQELQDLRIVPPQVTVGDRLTLHVGDQVVKLIAVGGHTRATTLVYLPAQRVLFAGDCFVNGYHPYMAQANTRDWLDALQTIRRLPLDVIVPGHGPLSTKEDTKVLSSYIRLARRMVRKNFQLGKSKPEATTPLVDELMPLFNKPTGRRDRLQSKIRAGLGRIYEDLKVEAAAREKELARAARSS
jgi:cyclase